MTDDPACPLPRATDAIELAHGGGGRSARRLLHELILPALGLAPQHATLDAAMLEAPIGARLAFTTDATVARPRTFPGGDLGTLAVYGSVNDLACVGARPLALSLSLLVEEGFSRDELRRVLSSVAHAASIAGVRVVTGDTKVLERGRGDGLYLSTAGVGVVVAPEPIGPTSIRTGDAVLVSGDVGRHGVAMLSARESLGFDTTLTSDCAPVTSVVFFDCGWALWAIVAGLGVADCAGAWPVVVIS